MITDDQIRQVVNQYSQTEKIVDYNVKYNDWNIDTIFYNTLWIQRLDEPDADLLLSGGEGGILLTPQQFRQTKGLYSIGKVIKAGAKAEIAKEGDYVMFGATGVGQSAQKPLGGYQTYFIRESDVIAIVSKPDNG
jgi:co-chaperonin GroES (HSP10)